MWRQPPIWLYAHLPAELETPQGIEICLLSTNDINAVHCIATHFPCSCHQIDHILPPLENQISVIHKACLANRAGSPVDSQLALMPAFSLTLSRQPLVPFPLVHQHRCSAYGLSLLLQRSLCTMALSSP